MHSNSLSYWSSEQIRKYKSHPSGKYREWTKILRFRQSGTSEGQKDLYIISPLGVKLRSTHDLAKHIEKNDLFSFVDPNVVNFEKILDDPEKQNPNKQSKITQDFVKWVESRGTTNPNFMQSK